MKTVLLPTDFSYNSLNAIEYAIHLFGNEEVKFILLNACELPHGNVSSLKSMERLFEEQCLRTLEEFHKEVTQKMGDAMPDMELVSEQGYVFEVINRAIQKHGADMVVMGTKGATGLKKVFIGSNSAEVIRHVTIPVIAVPEDAKFTRPQRIALATDYKSFEHSDVLNPLIEIAKSFESELQIFHVDIIKESTIIGVDRTFKGEELHNSLSELPHVFHNIYAQHLDEGIADFVVDNNIDMLAMVPHGQGFFERLFSGSMTEKIAMQTKVPLIVLDDRD